MHILNEEQTAIIVEDAKKCTTWVKRGSGR